MTSLCNVEKPFYWHLSFIITQLVLILSISSCQTHYDPIKNVDHRRDLKHIRKLAHEKLPAPFERLKPLHFLAPKPKPGEWQYRQKEKGQSILDYKKKYPFKTKTKYKRIYVQPIGVFFTKEWRLIKHSANYVRLYFDKPVVFLNRIPIHQLPKEARSKLTGDKEKIKTNWLLRQFLICQRPKDSFALLAFTNHYLFDEDKWGYVYGLSSLRKRVGAWSVRYLDENPGLSGSKYRHTLLRTVKMASHEITHMLSIKHCIAYKCLMNGCRNLEDLDRNPLALCPLCLYKLCWKTGIEPIKRYKRLAGFCQRNGLYQEAKFFRLSIKKMKKEE